MGKPINTSWKVASPSTNLLKIDSKLKTGATRQLLKTAPATKFYKPENQSLATPKLPSHNASPSLSANKLSPLDVQNNKKILPTDRKPFGKIKQQSEKFYDALRDTQLSIKNGISKRGHSTKSNNELKTALDKHKLWRDEVNETEIGNRKEAGEKAYDKIKGQIRPDNNSALENLLPLDSTFRRDLFPFTGGLRDPKIGLYAELRELPADINDKKNYVLCFVGTGRIAAIRAQMKTNVTQFAGMGGVPEAHKKALILTQELQKIINEKGGTLSLTGHSLGGGICNYVGTKLGIESTCFNSAALGGACVDDLKKSQSLSAENLKKQTHIRIKGDPVSSPRAQKVFSFLLGMAAKINIQVPQFIGKIYEAGKSDFTNGAPGKLDSHQLKSFDLLYKNQRSSSA